MKPALSISVRELTICTVSYGHRSLIEANIESAKAMNPGVAIPWIIVENTPEGKPGRFEIGETEGRKVIKGIANNFKGIAPGSYHHASGLNAAIKQVKTRYALVLDPDFYIVREDWAADILGHMERNGLTFFGAPYNPKRYMKYRYFPCIHCMFIDLDAVGKDEIDFSPCYDQARLMAGRERALNEASDANPTRTASSEPVVSNATPLSSIPSSSPMAAPSSKIKSVLKIWLRRSAIIGSSRDTGYKVYADFHSRPDGESKRYASECVQPVFKFAESRINPAYLASPFNRSVEAFLPDSMSYIPKDKRYYSSSGFKECAYPDAFSSGWDEFVWRGSAFGFHLQGARKDGKTTDHSGDLARLKEILDACKNLTRTKTIFVTIFEGVESKNILRTGIVDRILAQNPRSKIVLFVKNQARADYYAKEFTDPRLSFEVVAPYELSKIEKRFSSLKFNFLQTETTDLRAKLVAEERGKLYYYFSLIIHRVLARPFFIRIFRCLDARLVSNERFDGYFEKHRPDLVFLANLFEDFENAFLKSAKKGGVATVGLINSWDRVTARCILRTLPDKVIVFSDGLRDEMMETNDADPKDIFVSGIPQYDLYFRPSAVSRQEFFGKLGIDPSKKLLVYSPVGGMFSNSDWDIMDLIHDLNSRGRFGADVVMLVRFSPNDFIDPAELAKRPHLLYQAPGTRFSTVRSTDWDMTSAQLAELRDTLHHMSLIVCYASSISIDAAVCGKPVINIDFEVKDNGALSKSPTVFYPMTHYAKALAWGGIRLVRNEGELVEWVNKYINDPKLDEDGRKSLVKHQCTYLDGRSAERIAGYVTDLLL